MTFESDVSAVAAMQYGLQQPELAVGNLFVTGVNEFFGEDPQTSGGGGKRQ